MESSRLTGPNYHDWKRYLRLILRAENIEYVLDKPISVIPNEESEEYKTFDLNAHKKHEDDASLAQWIMLSSMTMELRRQNERMFPYEMLKHLESLYAFKTRSLEFVMFRELLENKLQEGKSVSEHVSKMMNLIERLSLIGLNLPESFAINLILCSLPPSFENFIITFNMSNRKAGLHDLYGTLKFYESIKSNGKGDHMVSSSATPTSKGNDKQKKMKASNATALKPKDGIQKKSKCSKDECLFCREKGHWKRDCTKFKEQGVTFAHSAER